MGTLGMTSKEARTTSLWDVHELSYLVLGLTSDFAFCGEQGSLQSAIRLADYLIAATDRPPRATSGAGKSQQPVVSEPPGWMRRCCFSPSNQGT